MTTDSGTVRIGAREVYDEVRELVGDVREVLRLQEIHEKADEEVHKVINLRLGEYSTRLRGVEAWQLANGSLPASLSALTAVVAKLEATVNRQAWVPSLITGVVGIGAGALVMKASGLA